MNYIFFLVFMDLYDVVCKMYFCEIKNNEIPVASKMLTVKICIRARKKIINQTARGSFFIIHKLIYWFNNSKPLITWNKWLLHVFCYELLLPSFRPENVNKNDRGLLLQFIFFRTVRMQETTKYFDRLSSWLK